MVCEGGLERTYRRFKGGRIRTGCPAIHAGGSAPPKIPTEDGNLTISRSPFER